VTAAIVGNKSLDRFDTLVIGSGSGGGAVAALLAKNGQKVLVLEAGANRFEGLDDPNIANLVTRHSNDEVKYRRSFIHPDELVEPRTFRKAESDGKRKFVGNVNGLPKTVGGGAVHADLKTPRFMPDDFHFGTLIGSKYTDASFADWPADYDALEPFYGYVEKAIGVQGIAGMTPFEPQRATPYPMPPGALDYASLKLAEGARKVGLHPFPYPCAINSRSYDGRPPCVDCGFCSGYGCPTHAKGSPAVTTVRQALLTGRCQLWPETRVVKLVASNNEITGVEAITSDGSRMTFKADRYVVAASPIEDARLLLLSDPSGLGNSSGLVGRNLMFHFQTIALAIFEERLHSHRGKATAQAVSDFRGVYNDPNRPLAGIIELGAGPLALEEALIYATQIGALGASLKKLVRQSPLRDRVAALTVQAEDAPQATNRIDLDPDVKDLDSLPVARITYQNHAFELSAREFYKPKLLDWLGASGAKWGFIAPADAIPASAHIMGTLRFGPDPRTSVCDPNGRFHDIGNLYAADGALFPTSSGFNPTLTIMTLATYVAAQMLFPGSPTRAIGA
jgi:choline dehydrogenase-like flavoprotein